MSTDPVWDIRDLGGLLWRWRKFLVANVAVVSLGSVLLAFALPVWFASTTTLLPPQEDDAGMSVSTMLRGLTVPGVKIPTQVSPGEMFVAVLTSRTCLTALVREFDLEHVYKSQKVEDAIKELRHHVSVLIGEDGLISVRVEDRDRARAAKMANRLVVLLDEWNRVTRSSRGKRARVFIGQRLDDTRALLASAEDSLRRYQRAKKSLMSPDVEGAAQVAAGLYSERLSLQMQLGMASSYAAQSNPEMQRLQLRLAELDRQIDKLPDLGVGTARLYRNVKIQEHVYQLLMAQYEEAKIQEAKDVATVEVLDPAIPAERKARPVRSVIVLVGFGVSVVLGLGYVLFTEYLRRVGHAT